MQRIKEQLKTRAVIAAVSAATSALAIYALAAPLYGN